MAPDPSRVASRYLTARAWTDFGAVWKAYNKALAALDLSVSKERASSYPNKYILRGYFIPLVEAGRVMSDWAIQTRSIPSGQVKSLELAARLMTMAVVPPNIIQWYDTNRPKLDLLLETLTWGEKGQGPSGGLELSTAGPFKVHNTIGAKESQLKEIQALVKAAAKAITPVMDFKKVLYGDVYVVGQLRKSQTWAWYAIAQDEVYLRNLAKKGVDDLASLIHELGHRYWFKFATADQKRNISALYSKLQSEANRVTVPDLKVGEVLPVKVVGLEPPLVITEVTPTSYMLRPKKTTLKTPPGYAHSVRINVVQSILKQRAATGKLFPSRYSMTSDMEFFAECFSFYILGKMSAGLVSQFEKALK
jgi:hypothetical protein